MWKFGIVLSIFFCLQSLSGGVLEVRVADLVEDMEILRRECGELRLEVEDINRQNIVLRERNEELKGELLELERRVEASQVEGMKEVSKKIAALSSCTQQAMEELVQRVKVAQVGRVEAKVFRFTDDYPREGVSYTVKAGDTLSVIAMKHRSKTRDIQNANRISDPRMLRAGQVLFIPQRD